MSAPPTPGGRRDRPDWAGANALLVRSLDTLRAAAAAEANFDAAQESLANSENTVEARRRAATQAEQDAVRAEQAAAEAMRRATERRNTAREREIELEEEEAIKADLEEEVDGKREEFERLRAQVREMLDAAEAAVGGGQPEPEENEAEDHPPPEQDGASNERGGSNGPSSFFTALANRFSGHGTSSHQQGNAEGSSNRQAILQVPQPAASSSRSGSARPDARANTLAPGVNSIIRRGSSGPTPGSTSSAQAAGSSLRPPLRPLFWPSATPSRAGSEVHTSATMVATSTTTSIGPAAGRSGESSSSLITGSAATSIRGEMVQIRPGPTRNLQTDNRPPQRTDVSVEIPVRRETPQGRTDAEGGPAQEEGAAGSTGNGIDRQADGQPQQKKRRTEDGRGEQGPGLNSPDNARASTSNSASGSSGTMNPRFHMRLRSSSPRPAAATTQSSSSGQSISTGAATQSRQVRSSELHHAASHARKCSSCGTRSTSSWKRTPIMHTEQDSDDGDNGSVESRGGDGDRPWLCQRCYMRARKELLAEAQAQGEGGSHGHAQAQAGPSTTSHHHTAGAQAGHDEGRSRSTGNSRTQAREANDNNNQGGGHEERGRGTGQGQRQVGANAAEDEDDNDDDEEEDWEWAIDRRRLETSSSEDSEEEDDDQA
ncbi:hypothetical protein CF319_g1786 [Tilletia indica]|nr:hypothetical protein CF319_g1786 [Tilletia indica]